MRISVLSTSDGGGGAAIAAYRLFRALGKSNADVGMTVLEKRTSDPAVEALTASGGVFSALHRTFRKFTILFQYARHRFSRPAGVDIFNSAISPFDKEMNTLASDADVINLHWIARFIDWSSFFGAIGNQKVIWTLHDQNPFTGGCHYTMGCQRFMTGCGRCPQLGSNDVNDISAQNFQDKMSILDNFDKSKLHIVAPSHWLAQEAGRSPIFKGVARNVIPNSVDVERFRPRDVHTFRDRFEVTEDMFLALFIAHNLGGERKGGDLLVEAMQRLEPTIRSRIAIVTVGEGTFALAEDTRHIQLEAIIDEETIAEVCSAVDVVVLPSREDNLPNTMLEAMACATPVVGFPVGGIPDFVTDGETGFLASTVEPQALSSAIERAYAARARLSEMGERCRELVLKECAEAVQSERYLELFKLR